MTANIIYNISIQDIVRNFVPPNINGTFFPKKKEYFEADINSGINWKIQIFHGGGPIVMIFVSIKGSHFVTTDIVCVQLWKKRNIYGHVLVIII